MAKLYLMGRNEPIELDEKKARELKNQWVGGTLKETVDLGTVAFNKRKIANIMLADDHKDSLGAATMTTEQIKEELGYFETQYNANFTGEKVRVNYLIPIPTRDKGIIDWAIKENVMVFYDKPYPHYRVNSMEFGNLTRNLDLLNELTCRRQYASKKEAENLSALSDEIAEEKKEVVIEKTMEEDIDPLESLL